MPISVSKVAPGERRSVPTQAIADERETDRCGDQHGNQQQIDEVQGSDSVMATAGILESSA